MFAPSARKRSGRGRWIGAARAAGSIIIDDGAVCALRDRNRSLLPAGIIRVEGDFSPGDIVAIASTNGQTIARGLSNYSRNDIERIRGRKTSQVREMLGEAAYDEVVHRSNLIIMSRSMKPDS